MRFLVLTSFVALSLFSACSTLTVHGPETRDMACTTDNLAPALDFLATASIGANIINSTVNADEPDSINYLALALTAAVGGVYLYSGYRGTQRTKECREHINNEFELFRQNLDQGGYEIEDLEDSLPLD